MAQTVENAPAGAAAPPVPILLVLIAVSLVMVVAMVRFSRTMVNRPLTPGGWLRHRGDGALPWGTVYLSLWLGIFAIYLWLTAATGVDPFGRNLGIFLLVAGAWLGVNAALIAFIRAIARANARSGRDRRSGVRLPPATEEETQAPPPLDTAEGAPEPEKATSLRGRLGRILATARNVAIVLLLVAGAELLPALKALDTYLATHRRDFLVPAVVMAAVGFVLLMGGAIQMVLAAGLPMDRRGADRLRGRSLERPGPAVIRRSAHRSGGTVVGAQAHDKTTFAEVKAAWRSGAWRTRPRWRRIFAMAAGAVFLLFGIFGVVFVLAPPGLKVLAGLVVGYAVARTVTGWVRA